MKFVEDLSEEELARLKKENEEIRRANAKAQREQEHLEQSGDKMKEHRQMADKPLHRDLPERGSLWARE